MRCFRPFAASNNFWDAIILVTVFLPLLLSACSTDDRIKETAPSETGFPVQKPSIRPDFPLEVSEKPADKELCRKIGEEIEKRSAPTETWGFMAVSLADGRVPCVRNARHLFLPASVQKLITATAALDKLGPEHRFKTSVFSDSTVKNGTLNIDLRFYGRGAPDLDKQSIATLIAQLRKQGLKRIEGDVIGDESYFKGDGLGDGWTWNEAQWYYGAAASALSFDRNQITVTIKDGKPSADTEFVELSGELKPVETIEAVGIKRKLGTNEVYVWGTGKDLKARIAVSDPALFAARVLKESLEKSGISVAGKARAVNWKYPTNTDELTELASVDSEPLYDTVRRMNRDSINLHAELLLRTLGRQFGSEAPDEDPKMNLLRGDDLAGAAVIEKWISEKRLADNEIAVHDGSGLSRLNRVSPELIVRVLILAAQSDYASFFTDSLPVSGQSGTLRARLGDATGRIAGKTGSIKYVNSLAGYAESGGETIAFAIICNDETTRSDSGRTIDDIAMLIAGTKK